MIRIIVTVTVSISVGDIVSISVSMLSSGEYDDKEEEEENLHEYDLEGEEGGMFDSQEARTATTGTASQQASTGVNLNKNEPNRDRD